MRTIETTAVVTAEHTLTIPVPADVPPGEHRVVILIQSAAPPRPGSMTANWPVFDLGPWPEGFTASREQIYGDDGR